MYIPYVAFIVVVDTETGPRVHSSEDSDVFVCEDAVDTPAVESGVSSVLPAGPPRHSRTQHGRIAVGVEASVVYNDWDYGTLVFIRFVLYVITLGFVVVCSLKVEFLCSVLLITRTCLLLAGLESVPSHFAHGDVSCPVCNVGPECCSGGTYRDPERDEDAM